MRERRKQCQTPREVFDYIQVILKADEPGVVERPAVPVTTKEVVPAPRVAAPKKRKAKPVNGHAHYSSSSEEERESAEEEELAPAKEVDEHGNEVISTSDAIWKTSAEVEHRKREYG